MTNDPQNRVSFHTLGCRLNQAESAALMDAFRRRGWRIVSFEEPADLCVINTCSVTHVSEQKCRQAIRAAIRRHPGARIVVTGCYAELAPAALGKIPGVDRVVGTAEKMRLPDLLTRGDSAGETGPSRRNGPEPFTQEGAADDPQSTRAHLKIQDGCSFVCSYCIVPRARGPARSRLLADVEREARELAACGYREIVLTGVNIGTYRDGDRRLRDVLDRLAAVEGIERIRISSVEPATAEEEVLERMAANRRICRHLHLPLQSGDDRILERMRRKYRVRQYESFVNRAVERIPGLAVGADVIVGFPGEDGEAFERTRSLVERLPLAYLHVFSFSPRPGTPAAAYPDRPDPRVISQRAGILRELSARKRTAFAEGHLGRELDVLFEDRDAAGRPRGLTDNYLRVSADGGAAASENDLGRVRATSVLDGGALAGELLEGTLR